MKWANFLHFYQPAGQQKDILEAVVSQCYRPLFKGFLENPKVRLTINVSGGLFEVLDNYGFKDVISDLKSLYESGRVEFTSTACYHAFLPLIADEEIIRQITLNNSVLKHYLGDNCSPCGFFPPEMGYSKRLGSILGNMGFKYMLLDEIACLEGGGITSNDSLYFSSSLGLNVFFRQRGLSNVIMSGIERNSERLHAILDKYATSPYVITAMDGETFGHHRPGLEKPFLETFNNPDIEFIRLSDLLANKDTPVKEVDLVDSTWASSEEDIAGNIQFISWNDPKNVLHKWQWELVGLMLSSVNKVPKDSMTYKEIRRNADKALASDQFFWASAKPWWSVEMIESGAHALLSVIESVPDMPEKDLGNARTLYRNIISTAFDWQRTGKIREMNKERGEFRRIPFKERTLEVGGRQALVYQAFINMMKSQEKKASLEGEYEKAILWRDAVYKIETKNDIYDALNAIDLLRIELSNEKVESILDKYTAKYREIRGGQPEQRSN